MPENASNVGILSMPLEPPASFDRRDANLATLYFLLIGAAYVFVALSQQFYLDARSGRFELESLFLPRAIAAFLPISIGALAFRWFQVWRIQKRRQRLATAVVFTLGLALMRTGLAIAYGLYPDLPVGVIVVEIASGCIMYGIVTALATSIARSQRLERESMLQTQRAHNDALQAIEALRLEEARVHQNVSEALHGTVQQRFVLLEARIDALLKSQSQAPSPCIQARAQLQEIRDELAQMRDETIRATSRLLSPDGLELGLRPAIRIILGRLPAPIARSFSVDEATREIDNLEHPVLTQSQRLVCLRFVEEAVTNALKHGHATGISVDIATRLNGEAGLRTLQISVANNGLEAQESEDGTGLVRLRQRAAIEGGSISMTSTVGDTVVQLEMPVRYIGESTKPSGGHDSDVAA